MSLKIVLVSSKGFIKRLKHKPKLTLQECAKQKGKKLKIRKFKTILIFANTP